jgi:hypothetical protein
VQPIVANIHNGELFLKSRCTITSNPPCRGSDLTTQPNSACGISVISGPGSKGAPFIRDIPEFTYGWFDFTCVPKIRPAGIQPAAYTEDKKEIFASENQFQGYPALENEQMKVFITRGRETP